MSPIMRNPTTGQYVAGPAKRVEMTPRTMFLTGIVIGLFAGFTMALTSWAMSAMRVYFG